MRNAETTAREAAKAMRDFAKLLKKTIENKMNKQIFKKGDKVYHYRWGWGEFLQYFEDDYRSGVAFKDGYRGVYSNELSFTEYTLKGGGLSHERPLQLEVGKSYVSDSGFSMIINLIGERENYGFWHGNWVDDLIIYAPDAPKTWREATDEEVRSALEKEAIRRFGENWQDVKIVQSVGTSANGDNKGRSGIGIFESSEQGGLVVWNKNGRLFHKGKWAEKLEEPEFERPLYFELEKSSGFDLDGILNENIICNDPESFTEAIKRLVSEKLEEPEFKPFQKVLVRDSQSTPWRIDLFSNMRGNCEYPYRCMTACWSQCIPYEGNEHLLGTSKSPEK